MVLHAFFLHFDHVGLGRCKRGNGIQAPMDEDAKFRVIKPRGKWMVVDKFFNLFFHGKWHLAENVRMFLSKGKCGNATTVRLYMRCW